MPFKLHALPKKHVDEELRESVIALCEKTIAQARNGQVDGLVVIRRQVDGAWSWDASAPHTFSEVVGRLEILKHEWISRYLSKT